MPVGLPNLGGGLFYDAKRVTIRNTRFYDSNRQPVGDYDRFAYLFSRGSQSNETLRIHDNLIQDLQLEVDYARDVVIEKNTVQRPVATAGIGTFSLNDGGLAQDFYIRGKTIIDPIVSAGGITVHLDPPTTNNCTFRNIHIENNVIKYTATTKPYLAAAIWLGTPNNSVATTGNVFNGIWIVRNEIRVACNLKNNFEDGIIFGANSKGFDGVPDFSFDNLTITDNTFYYNGTGPLIRVDRADVNYVQACNVQLRCSH